MVGEKGHREQEDHLLLSRKRTEDHLLLRCQLQAEQQEVGKRGANLGRWGGGTER